MSYKINTTTGELLTEISDGNIDTLATDLTLIGKNVTGYGEYLNENFVKLLENFASTSEPNNPIKGQIWYDLTENRLKVYDGNGFRIGSGPVISNDTPLNPTQGDFWIDNNEKQLYFYDGTGFYPASKIYKDSQGYSGFEIATVFDLYLNDKTIVKLWCGDVLLGIFSNHEEFTPSVAIPNFTGNIKKGFNIADLTDFKFHGVATSTESVIDSLGNVIPADSLLVNNKDNFTSGTLTIGNSTPLVLGVASENSIVVNESAIQIRSNRNGQDFKITTLQSSTPYDAITVKAATNRVGIFNLSPSATLHVNGSTVIDGDLTVNGTTTNINSTNLVIEDKEIVLSDVTSPTDITADGSGFRIKGATDKTLLWEQTTNSFDSSENFNLAFSKSYHVNGNSVLSEDTLGSTVVNAPGLGISAVSGVITELAVDNIRINGNTISTTVGSLQLSPVGVSVVDVVNSRITNLQDPLNPQDAATKNYVDNAAPLPWQEIPPVPLTPPYEHESSNGERLLISTGSGPVSVVLPNALNQGDTIRFLDFDNTFDADNLTIKRFRRHINLSGTSSTNLSTYPDKPCITVTGIGTGLRATVEITAASSTYTTLNTLVTITDHGVGYRDGDTVRILGSELGGTDGVNDLIFNLELEPILGVDDDLVINTQGAGFGLIYTNAAQGWRYVEVSDVPNIIYADIFGNLTGNVTGNVTGNLTGNVTGNLTGNVTGNINGTVLAGNQPYITSLGSLSSLNVLGAISGNVTGNLTGNVTGNISNNTLIVNGDNTVSIESGTGAITIVSGTNGLRVSAFENTATQEHYVIDTAPATSPTGRPTTKLFGNIVVENQSSGFVNGSSFRLPQYTTTQRDALTYSALNYGELIYNTTTNKVQAYTSGGWVDLH